MRGGSDRRERRRQSTARKAAAPSLGHRKVSEEESESHAEEKLSRS
jgi:hypothetical protein